MRPRAQHSSACYLIVPPPGPGEGGLLFPQPQSQLPAPGSLDGSSPSVLAYAQPPPPPLAPRRPIQSLSFQSVPAEDTSVALARGAHAITRAGRFRCAAKAAGTGLPGDPWCAVAAATRAPVPPRLLCPCSLPRASRGLNPGALGRRLPSLCANLRSSTRPSRLRSATLRGSKRGSGDSAPCVAGRGRGAGAPPAPGMRARALASTFFLPLSRLEPPLAYSGERECTDHHPCRAPGPGTPWNVSREARELLRVSPALQTHPAQLSCSAT